MWFFAAVQCQVSIVVCPLCELFVANTAFVWLLTGMRSHVHRQDRRVRKVFFADFAWIRFVAGMTEPMVFQIVRTLIFLFADIATISIHTDMHAIMVVEDFLRTKSFVTKCTTKRLITRMDLLMGTIVRRLSKRFMTYLEMYRKKKWTLLVQSCFQSIFKLFFFCKKYKNMHSVPKNWSFEPNFKTFDPINLCVKPNILLDISKEYLKF